MHVELTLSELPDPTAPRQRTRPGGRDRALDVWAFAVTAAAEACLLVNTAGVVIAASPGSADLLNIDPAGSVGRRLVEGVLRLLDFNAVSGELPGWEVDKIPPLLALSTGGLARGLLRIDDGSGTASTVDAISTPLREGGELVGSLTFFAPVGR